MHDGDARKSYSLSVPEDDRTAETCFTRLVKLIKILINL
jgi:hypothetical protein